MKSVTGLSKVLINETGEPFNDKAKVSDVIASSLFSMRTAKDPVRAYKLALKIKECADTIEMEDQDYTLAVEAVKAAPAMVIVMGQVLEVLEAGVEKKDLTPKSTAN